MADVETFQTHTVVIGAGVAGLAIARKLSMQGNEVVVLEAGQKFGEGLSSRNSEVVHGGLYYPENSLKARLCVEGRRALYEYCQRHKVPFNKCGKWIVAKSQDVERLAQIQQQAERNGVRLDWVGDELLNATLPDIDADAALFSPETGIVDSHKLMMSLLAELQNAGGHLICQAPVDSVNSEGGAYQLHVSGPEPCRLKAKNVVNAAGLGAVQLANRWDAMPGGCIPQQWYARGVYFSYSGRHPFNSLIYPVPEPGGLGVHLTLDMAGQARFGPDVEWIESPEFTVDPQRSVAFASAIRRWWPGLDGSRLQPAYAGVRPKLSGPEGGFTDFRIDGEAVHGLPGVVNLFGIESPGLTAALAIAEEVGRLLKE